MSKYVDKIISHALKDMPDGRKFTGADKYRKMAEYAFDNNKSVSNAIIKQLSKTSGTAVSYNQAKNSFASHFESRMKNEQKWAAKMGRKPDSPKEVLKQAIKGQGFRSRVATENWMHGFQSGLGKGDYIQNPTGTGLAGRSANSATYKKFVKDTGWKGTNDDYKRLVYNAATKYFEYTDSKGVVWIFEMAGVSPVRVNYRKK